jgi:hypothetical protein
MAEVKGKFITLVGILSGENPMALKMIDEYLEAELSLNHLELDPEEFYDTLVFAKVIRIYSQQSLNPKQAIIEIGKRVYPTIKRSVGLPTHLKTAKDFILFEIEGFKLNHSSDVEQRRIISQSENSVEVYAPAPDYDEDLFVGVWIGILEMCHITSGKVEHSGNHVYIISW